MSQGAQLRRGVIEDAPAIARLHLAAWREAYADLMPAVRIEAFTLARRREVWDRALVDPAAAVVLVEEAGALLGFGAAGPQRDPALAAKGFDAEIGALYVLRAAQRRGFGRRLAAALAAALADRGHRAAALFVLRDNAPARAFYARLGGVLIDGVPAGDPPEVAYGWRRLHALRRDVAG